MNTINSGSINSYNLYIKAIKEAKESNNLIQLYPSNIKYLLFLTPIGTLHITKNKKLFECVAPFNTWSCIFFETLEKAQEFATKYPDYDFIVLDITGTKPKILRAEKEQIKKTVEVEEIEEKLLGFKLEEIGD